jgi:hypothetical protein
MRILVLTATLLTLAAPALADTGARSTSLPVCGHPAGCGNR